jgi:predicted unusual protein kinase regulating ubiquinone biosynthesis (AarF/ABC1/UbiB family)
LNKEISSLVDKSDVISVKQQKLMEMRKENLLKVNEEMAQKQKSLQEEIDLLMESRDAILIEQNVKVDPSTDFNLLY